MKRLILSLSILVSSSAFAMDPAAQFVENTLNSGIQMLRQQKSINQTTQLCQLITQSFDTNSIGMRWLGTFAGTDKGGSDMFMNMIPSMLATKLLMLAGNTATITVNPTATDVGNSNYLVDLTINVNGQMIGGQVVTTMDSNGKFLVSDVEAGGMSGVNYLGQDFQAQFTKATQNGSTSPVMDTINNLMADPNYIQCP